jgi:hypothetical protein
VEIGEQDAKYFSQAQVLEKIRTSNNTLDLKIITPMLYTNKPVCMRPRSRPFTLRNYFRAHTREIFNLLAIYFLIHIKIEFLPSLSR